MMVPRTVSSPVGGGAARTSRVPTAPELLKEAWHVAEDLPLFLTAPLYRRWHLHWGATPAEARRRCPVTISCRARSTGQPGRSL
jgi:hypothetical protein